jgi:hypothetical protein
MRRGMWEVGSGRWEVGGGRWEVGRATWGGIRFRRFTLKPLNGGREESLRKIDGDQNSEEGHDEDLVIVVGEDGEEVDEGDGGEGAVKQKAEIGKLKLEKTGNGEWTVDGGLWRVDPTTLSELPTSPRLRRMNRRASCGG